MFFIIYISKLCNNIILPIYLNIYYAMKANILYKLFMQLTQINNCGKEVYFTVVTILKIFNNNSLIIVVIVKVMLYYLDLQ